MCRRSGIFQSVVEKSDNPPSNLANAGIYLFKRSIFDDLRALPKSVRGEYELTDGLNRAAARESIRIIELKSWLEIGRPWDILAANELLLPEVAPQIEGEVEPGARLMGNVSIGRGTVVRSGAYIVGPVLIGERLRYRSQLLHPAHDVHRQQCSSGKRRGGQE